MKANTEALSGSDRKHEDANHDTSRTAILIDPIIATLEQILDAVAKRQAEARFSLAGPTPQSMIECSGKLLNEGLDGWLRSNAMLSELKKLLSPFPDSEMQGFRCHRTTLITTLSGVQLCKPEVNGSQLITRGSERPDASEEVRNEMLC